MIFFDRGLVDPYDCALMHNDPLPSQVDVRKLTIKDVEISNNFSPDALPRFASLLAGNEGLIESKLHFYVDDSRKRRVDGHVKAEVSVPCQRCLEPVTITVESEFKLAVLWTDEQAKQLDKSLEPLIVGEELIDLADIVEEELILSLPIVSYHNRDDCQEMPLSFGDEHIVRSTKVEQKKNPFSVLEKLKPAK